MVVYTTVNKVPHTVSGGLLLGEAVATIFAIIDFKSRSGLKLVTQIYVSDTVCFNSWKSLTLSFIRQDILFSIAIAICYGATGIACAIYAAEWSEPPEGCDYSDCDAMGLTATNALSTVR